MKNNYKNLAIISLATLIAAGPFFGSYVPRAKATGLSTLYNLVGEQDEEMFGKPVQFIGDINNDTYEDFAVGSMGYDLDMGVNGIAIDAGRIQIYSGQNGALIRAHTQLYVNTASASAFFGSAFSGIGDVNGDGYGDYVITDPRFSTGEGGAIANERGRIFAFSGANGGVLWTYKGTEDYQFMGGNSSIMSARDFNSDGKRDVAVGIPGSHPNGEWRAGAIMILDAVTGVEITRFNGTKSDDYVGRSFDTGFDINGDGVEDFILGYYLNSDVAFFAGAVKVISGQDLANPAVIYTQPGPGTVNAFFGVFVQLLGDTNNDGRSDFAVSSIETVATLDWAGSLRIFSGLDNSLIRQFSGTEKDELFSWSLADAGDMNNDGPGYKEVISAGLMASNGAGRADAFDVKTGAKWDKIPGGASGENVGSDIDAGKDVNKDGIPDLILGSIGGQFGSIFPGRARVVKGDPTHVPAGASIEVHPEIGKTGTSLVFPTVTTSGNITLTYLNQTATGANFRAKQANKLEYWIITTNAAFSGNTTVCVKYNQAAQGYDETKIDLQHLEGTFTAKTTTRDAANDVVCGTVTSL